MGFLWQRLVGCAGLIISQRIMNPVKVLRRFEEPFLDTHYLKWYLVRTFSKITEAILSK